MTPLDDDTVTAEPTKPSPINEVHLVGRLSKPAIIKELPSGDLLGTWRLVVARPERIRPTEHSDVEATPAAGDVAPSRRRQSYDTIDCVSFDLDLIGRISDVGPGTLLDLRGALRRRFPKALPGGQSRYEVEVLSASVLTASLGSGMASSAVSAGPGRKAEPIAGFS